MPRPLGVGPGLHGRRLTGYELHDELRAAEGQKVPWPEEVRDADADMWGWPEEAKLRGDPEAGEWPNASQAQPRPASRPPARLRKPHHTASPHGSEDHNLRQHVSQLPPAEQQNLQQVEQRNSEMAAIFAQLHMHEQMRQAVQARLSQPPYAPDIHPSGEVLDAMLTLSAACMLQLHTYRKYSPCAPLIGFYSLKYFCCKQALLSSERQADASVLCIC